MKAFGIIVKRLKILLLKKRVSKVETISLMLVLITKKNPLQKRKLKINYGGVGLRSMANVDRVSRMRKP